MDSLFNAADLQNLSNLLNQGGNNNDSDSEEEMCSTSGRKKVGGASRHAPENPRFKVNIRRVTADDPCEESGPSNGKGDSAKTDEEDDKWAIWNKDEVPSMDTLPDDANLDPRITPEYDIMYQQSVTSEDIYLQMGGKTPSSVSCEDMLVTIQLPGEQRENVDCDLTTQHVDIRSIKYRLALPLPHPVLPHLCQATWDSDKSKLKLTLRLTREFDCVNF
ncbi:hypothetical protein M8J77_025715 [Diaphorina citri]|nr:hypothetical protein M8J77_025715 [Diaphorina citri]